MKKEQTPNCSVCRWRQPSNLFSGQKCKAQGEKNTSFCYNSPQCKELYTDLIPIFSKNPIDRLIIGEDQ